MLQMVQKFKEKNNTTLNFRDYSKDEYRCVTHTNFGLLRSSPAFIQIAGKLPRRYSTIQLFNYSVFTKTGVLIRRKVDLENITRASFIIRRDAS